MALWFECKVRYDKMQENGAVKKVTEPYLVDALSFTEAEARIIEEMKPFISGEFSISAVKKTKISEIFFDETGDRYYQTKVNFITIDDKGIEKKSATLILVQASDFEGALRRFNEGMKDSAADYEIASIAETMLMDVYPADLSGKHAAQP
ncbi:MAG TPA: phage tail protein [Porphyromonadaceae bacterium]|nr:phage tail protein [Porphyromonadaceae bacterium]